MNYNGSEKFLCIYNCGGHVDTLESKEALAEINDQIRKLLANTTDLIHPLDSLVILKITDVWREA